MTPYTRDELLQLAPLYAAGATTPEETAAVERAVREDESLALEVAAYRDVATSLATARSVAPSPELRARLLDAVATEKQKSVPAAPVRGAAVSAVSSGQRPAGRSPLPRWVPVALAASLVLAAGLAAGAVTLRGELDVMRSSVAALDARLAARERTLNTLLEAERDLRVVYLRPADGDATAPGMQFFWNAKQGTAVAHVFRLSPAPDGRDYQIWALVDGKPVSLGVFNSDPDGHALVESLTLPPSTAGVTAVLVSVEPKGGSEQPTTAPFMGGSFPAS